MKKLFFAVLAFAALCVSSCNKPGPDDPMYFAVATVTMRPQTDGSFYMKSTEKTALVAVNEDLQKYPFKDGKEHRAYVRFGYYPEKPATHSISGYEETVDITVIQLDTIRTMNPLVYEESKEVEYGKSPLGLYVTDEVFPTTCIEDGYLCVRAAIPYGISGVAHSICLLKDVNPSDPYTVELRHNMNGDSYIDTQDELFCFPLKDLPDTEGRTVTLTVQWLSLVTGNMETATFDYCTRTDW